MARNERSSRELAGLAAKILADKGESKDARRLAGSVLTQAEDKQKPKRKTKTTKRGPHKPRKRS